MHYTAWINGLYQKIVDALILLFAAQRLPNEVSNPGGSTVPAPGKILTPDFRPGGGNSNQPGNSNFLNILKWALRIAPLVPFVFPQPAPDEDDGDDDNDKIFYHYTDQAGYNSIISSGLVVIRPNKKNQVFVTREQYGPYDAWIALFAGNESYRHKGAYFFEFTLNEGVTLHPGTQPNELIHYGSMTQGAEIKAILRHGTNPFEDYWK